MFIYKNGQLYYTLIDNTGSNDYQALGAAFALGLITSITNDVHNNYLTTNQINELLAKIRGVHVVPTKPTTPLKNTIYYVGSESPFDVYLYDFNGDEWYLGQSDLNIDEKLDKLRTYNKIYGTDGSGNQIALSKVTSMSLTPTDTNILTEKGTKEAIDAIIVNDDLSSNTTTLGAATILELIENYTPDTTKELTDVDWNKSNVKFNENYSNCLKKAGKYYGLMTKVDIPKNYTVGRKKILELPFEIGGETLVYGYITYRRKLGDGTEYVFTEVDFVNIIGKDVYYTLTRITPDITVQSIELVTLIDRKSAQDNGTDLSQEFESLNGSITFKNLFYREYNGMTVLSFYGTLANVSEIKFINAPLHNMQVSCILGDSIGLHHGISFINKDTKTMPVNPSYTSIAMQVVWFTNPSDETNFGQDIIDANPNKGITVCNARYINGFALQEIVIENTPTEAQVTNEQVNIDRTPVKLPKPNIIPGTISGTYSEEGKEDLQVTDNNGKLIIGEDEVGNIDYVLGSVSYSSTKSGTLVLSYSYEYVEPKNIDETININHSHWINGIEENTESGSSEYTVAWNKVKSVNNSLHIDNKVGRLELNGIIMSIADLPNIIVPDLPSRYGRQVLMAINGIPQWVEVN